MMGGVSCEYRDEYVDDNINYGRCYLDIDQSAVTGRRRNIGKSGYDYGLYRRGNANSRAKDQR